MQQMAIVADEQKLRARAEEVPLARIGSEKMKRLIAAMSATLAKENDGVALAAPQVGEPLRLFIVSGKVLARQKRKKQSAPESAPLPDAVFVNPVILKSSPKKQEVEEGCLSLRWLYGKVRRAARVTIEARNEGGEKVTRAASGLLAQIFQHEIDHLDGVLFTDKAAHVINMPPTTNYEQDTKIRKET